MGAGIGAGEYEVRGPAGRAAGNPYHSPWPGNFSIHHLLTPTLITQLTLSTQIVIFWEKNIWRGAP